MPLHRDIHWIGRQWAVTGHGMQLIDQKLKGFFDIEVARLWDDALIATTRGKEWLNGADFEKGLEVARKRFPADGVAPPVVSTPPVAPPPAVELAPAPEVRSAAPATPVVPAPSKAPTAPVIVSVKPAAQKPAPAPIAERAEPPLHELEAIEPTRSTPGKFNMGFSGHAKFIRPWRVRMKQ